MKQLGIGLGESYVVDTSSLTWIKRAVPFQYRQPIFDALTHLAEQGGLLFPKEVVAELDEYKAKNGPDLPCAWAKQHRNVCTRYGDCYEELAIVLADPVVQLTLDVEKSSGPDEADPHVLALAYHLKQNNYSETVYVVTQEKSERPDHIPLNNAAGALGIPSFNMHALLTKHGIAPYG